MLLKARQNATRAVNELKSRARKSLRHSNFKRFIVLTRSRTGSNLLISFLNSHPNISVEGELFNRLDGQNYDEILTAVFARQPFKIKAKGFKIFYYHPNDDRTSRLWVDLVNMDDLQVIHLKRQNILRTLISRKIADLNGQWQVVDSSELETRKARCVYMSAEELERGFRNTQKWENDGDEMFLEHPLMTVYYEDLVKEPEANFNNITRFLGVHYVQPQTSLMKQNPEKTSELLINFDELNDAFLGTEWHKFFEEDGG